MVYAVYTEVKVTDAASYEEAEARVRDALVEAGFEVGTTEVERDHI